MKRNKAAASQTPIEKKGKTEVKSSTDEKAEKKEELVQAMKAVESPQQPQKV